MTKFLILKLFILSGFVLCLGIGAFLYAKNRKFNRNDAVFYFGVPAVILSGFVTLVWYFLYTPFLLINGKRLAPAISWVMGYQPYYALEEGPLINPIYGPVTYITYLITAFGEDPNGVFVLAAMTNTALVCIPAILVCVCLKKEGVSLPHSVLSFFLIITWFASDPTATYMVWNMHADAPQLAFGLLAATSLYVFRLEQRRIYLLLAAIFISLAIFSKQTAIFLLPALLLYVWILAGWRGAVHFFGLILIIVGVMATLLIYLFGGDELYLNLVLVPGGHPRGGLSYLVDAAFEGLSRSWWIIFVGLVLILICPNGLPKDISDFKKEWWLRNGWAIYALCAIFLVPISLLARTKVGGDVNSFQFIPYLIYTVVVLAAETIRTLGAANQESCIKVSFAFVTTCIAFSLTAMYGPLQQSHAFFNFSNNPQQKVFEYLMQNPGQAFFPSHTLPSLLATGTLYHWDSGPYQRTLAGLSPSNAHIMEYIPENVELIIYPPGGRSGHRLIKEMPGKFDRTKNAEFPGWTVYKKVKE